MPDTSGVTGVWRSALSFSGLDTHKCVIVDACLAFAALAPGLPWAASPAVGAGSWAWPRCPPSSCCPGCGRPATPPLTPCGGPRPSVVPEGRRSSGVVGSRWCGALPCVYSAHAPSDDALSASGSGPTQRHSPAPLLQCFLPESPRWLLLRSLRRPGTPGCAPQLDASNPPRWMWMAVAEWRGGAAEKCGVDARESCAWWACPHLSPRARPEWHPTWERMNPGSRSAVSTLGPHALESMCS